MLLRNRNLYILADMATVILSFFLTALARYASFRNLRLAFSNLAGCGLLVSTYILVILFYQPAKRILERGRWNELQNVMLINLFMAMAVSMTYYLGDYREMFPRSFYMLFFVFNCLLMYMERLYIVSAMTAYYRRPENKKKVLVCANSSNVRQMIRTLRKSRLYGREIVGVAVFGPASGPQDMVEISMYEIHQEENGPKPKHSAMTLEEYAKKYVVDEALLGLPDYDKNRLENLIQYFETMGINVHVTINTFGLTEKEKQVENFGDYHVLTYTPRVFDPTELFLKRALDILGAVVGLILTGLLSIAVVPLIYLESPGPVIFKQTRIGLNGRRFKIYKFRSMYMDAEERKKELMAKNEMSGLMFKMKDDPRITKVGKFIRKTSIDEFPQFFNVLKGEMSLVGTRPPTEDEFMQYEERHKRRLSLKPGITGLWQVSGRSDIQDFEDVVKLDCEYIDNWTLGLDIKILVQTVLVVLGKKGAE